MPLGPSPGRDEPDVYSRLLADRIVLVGRALDDEVVNTVVAQLLLLESQDPSKDIGLYVNSGGGPMSAALPIYDAMQSIAPDVSTLCTGHAAGGASILLAGGARGKRSALPHARILLQQPSHPGLEGTATAIRIQVDQFLRDREVVLDIYARHTGRPKEQVERELERDYYMTPEQARDWGLIDNIVERK